MTLIAAPQILDRQYTRRVQMRFLLNIIWLLLAGIWMALGYVLAAVICFVLIITIPFGVAALRIAGYTLWPFGRTIVRKPGAGGGSMIANAIWILLCGWWLALGHLVTGIALCITVIGIPLGLASFKLIPISLTPFGHEIVRVPDRIPSSLSNEPRAT
jgi:uncharacterized membrane protein YccF (DUF307 family)